MSRTRRSAPRRPQLPPHSKRLPEDDRALLAKRAAELRAGGARLAVIAWNLGAHQSSVKRWLQAAGLSRDVSRGAGRLNHERAEDARMRAELALELRQNGKTLRQIARKVKVTLNTLRRYLRER